jgi:hypothetical protein
MTTDLLIDANLMDADVTGAYTEKVAVRKTPQRSTTARYTRSIRWKARRASTRLNPFVDKSVLAAQTAVSFDFPTMEVCELVRAIEARRAYRSEQSMPYRSSCAAAAHKRRPF